MKLLHTSDWHFGKNAPAIGSYSSDQAYFLEQLERIIADEGIGAVLCAGDVYDSAKVASEAVSLYNDAASAICIKRGLPFVVIAGNHDSAERLTSCSELLEKANLYVRGHLSKSLQPVLLDEGKTAVYAIPFFIPGTAAALWPDKGIRTMTEAVTAVLDHIRENMDPSRCNVLMMHLSVSGAQLSESDRSAANASNEDGHVIGGSSSVSTALFHDFDYVALGHIHMPQELGCNVRYSGTPVKYSFGREEKQTKGVYIFDTETREITFKALDEKHDRKSITCTMSEAMNLTGLDTAYLKLTITDLLPDMQIFSRLQERFPFLMELQGTDQATGRAATSLTAGDIRELNPESILRHFMQDTYQQEEVDQDLIDLFMDAFAHAEKEE